MTSEHGHPADLVERSARIVLRPIGNPLPLGFLALAVEDAKRRTILPVGRRGWGLESMEGNLPDQLERIEREAGVREQL